MIKKEFTNVSIVIASLVCRTGTLQDKHIKGLKNMKKSFSEQHRINVLINELNTSLTHYKRKSNSTKELKFHCDMINAIVERIGKDFIFADNEETFKKHATGKRVMAILNQNNLKVEFRETVIQVPIEPVEETVNEMKEIEELEEVAA